VAALLFSAGFKVQGTLRRAIRDGERYFDEDLMILCIASRE
jgi:hypothetical protein